MKDNQKKYLDRVVDLIVRDTRIDYDKEEIHYPLFPFSSSFHSSLLFTHYAPFYFSFTNYCRDTYGLNEEETEYVWDEYKDIIIDKIRNEK